MVTDTPTSLSKNQSERIQSLKQQIKSYEGLCNLLLTIGSTLDVKTILDRVVKGAVSLCRADEGAILLFDPTGENTAKTLIREGLPSSILLDHYLNTLLAGWITRHRKPLLTDNLLRTFGQRHVPEKYRTISSVLAVPLTIRREITGVIHLIRREKRAPFSEWEQHLMHILASQCAQFIANARLHEELFRESARLRREVEERYAFHGIIGRSEKMQAVFTLLERILPTDTRVLLEGETGTGKELIARVLHYNGPRKDGPFVALDCGALPANLLESELFGYVKGAFTGAHQDRKGLLEAANGGTIFLDEIVNMPLEVQGKLLRAIETCEIRPLGSNRVKQIDIRIIAAASDDLRSRVEAGRFRRDLFYRLNVVSIHLPPLRERGDDLVILAHHFLEKMAQQYGKPIAGFRPETLAGLENYHWPGNVRELENVIERMIVLAPSDTEYLEPELLPAHLPSVRTSASDARPPDSGKRTLKTMTEAFEKALLREALEKSRWNQSSAARELGISERMVRYKMQKFGISRD